MGDHDKYAYWNMMDQYGKNLTPETAEYFATRACRSSNLGGSEDQVVHIGEQSGLPGYIARLAVKGAEYHYCPPISERSRGHDRRIRRRVAVRRGHARLGAGGDAAAPPEHHFTRLENAMPLGTPGYYPDPAGGPKPR
jgi:hypothetical protein